MVEAIVENKLEEFKNRLGPLVKKMLYDGFIPQTWLWAVTKISIMLNIADELRMAIRVNDWIRETKVLGKYKFLRNYKFLYCLNKIYTIKKYFKRYYWMDGHKLFVKPAPKMGEIVMDYQLLKIWEPETTDIVKREVGPGMTCIDIGASIGYFTLLFSRQVGPSGHVISVEPTDFQQPYLLKNIKNNGYKDRVEVWNVGAWDKTETVWMPLTAPRYVQTEAPCMAVDDIVNGRKIDFIKLDCDGPEPKVLKGLEKTFQNNPDLKMVVEYYPKYQRDSGLDPADFREIIDRYFEFEIIPGDYSEGCWNLFCKRKDNAKNIWPIENGNVE